jgi:hypothetical protein
VSEGDRLQELTHRLEQAAIGLRTGELAPQEAAQLVEECARLAGDAAHELDRRARVATEAPAQRPGQGELLAP